MIENYMALAELPPHPRRSRLQKAAEENGVNRAQVESAAFAETEHRLYALPIIRARVEDAREELCELENLGIEALKSHSASLIRIIRPGMRLDPEEVHAAQMATLRARIAADEREIKKVNVALAYVSHDTYFDIIEMKYFLGKPEHYIADRLRCDPSTVGRNRRRLVRLISVRLYGV